MVSDTSLSAFIASHPDARELKRALAVQMTLLGIKQGAIQAILGVQSSFISTWKKRYLSEGVACFRLGYKGSQPYLSADQRAQIHAWLVTQSQPSVASLASYIQTQFGVVFKSSQRYYAGVCGGLITSFALTLIIIPSCFIWALRRKNKTFP